MIRRWRIIAYITPLSWSAALNPSPIFMKSRRINCGFLFEPSERHPFTWDMILDECLEKTRKFGIKNYDYERGDSVCRLGVERIANDDAFRWKNILVKGVVNEVRVVFRS